jgi:outer membrane protein TolC
MNRSIKNIFVVLIFFEMIINCFAQEIINLEQVRSLALSNSRSLAKINLSIQNALLTEKAEIFDYLPSINVGASASTSLWGELNIEDSFDTGINIGIEENVLLWNGGRKLILSEINNIATEMTRKQALSEYFSVLDSADESYYGVLLSQASLESANLSLENSALALSIAEIHREGGMINLTDLLQAQADYESKKTSYNQAKRDVSLSLAKLKSITRLTEIPNLYDIDFTKYSFLIEKLSLLSDEEINNLFAELWKIFSSKNPNFSQAALTLRRADQNLNLAAKDFFPRLSAGFSTGIDYTLRNGFNLSDGRVSLTASIPLDIWVIANKVQSEKISHQQSILDYEETENQYIIDIQSGILDCISQAATIISSEKALEYAEKYYESVFELYRLSQNSISDLSEASSLVNSNRNQLIRAQYSFLSYLSVIRSLGAFDSDQAVLDFLLGTEHQ